MTSGVLPSRKTQTHTKEVSLAPGAPRERYKRLYPIRLYG